jgi:sorbitol/mannitol transport system substrate-binding protein
VNNGDMIRMQGLTSEFNAAHPDIQVNWVTLEENILRERVTTDITTGGGQYDALTIGNYEVPIWGKQGWCRSSSMPPTTSTTSCRPSAVA